MLLVIVGGGGAAVVVIVVVSCKMIHLKIQTLSRYMTVWAEWKH